MSAPRDDDLAEALGVPRRVLAGGHRGGDRVARILGRASRDALQAEARERRARPVRPPLRSAGAVPARPRGGREDLDDLGGERLERAVQPKALDDPGVVAAGVHPRRVRRPADAADGAGERPLVRPARPPVLRAGARAVDPHDGRPLALDEGDDVLDGEPPLQPQQCALVDQGGVEALARAADVDAEEAQAPSSTRTSRSAWVSTS